MGVWRTETVVLLCAAMRQEQRYSACAILADALQDEDYPDETMLTELRRTDLKDWEAERLVAQIYSDETSAAVDRINKLAEELGPMGYPGAGWYDGDVPDEEEDTQTRMTYEKLMASAKSFAETGDDLVGDGCMDWSNTMSGDVSTQFWKDYQTVTGREPPESTWDFLSCAC